MSKVEIINRALLKLGEPPGSSLNDAAFGKSYETIYEEFMKMSKTCCCRHIRGGLR